MVPVFEQGAKQTLDHENVHLEEKSFALVVLFPENGSKVPGNFQKYKVGGRQDGPVLGKKRACYQV